VDWTTVFPQNSFAKFDRLPNHAAMQRWAGKQGSLRVT